MMGAYRLIPIAEWGNVQVGLVVHRVAHCGAVSSVFTLDGKPCFNVEWYTDAREARALRRAGGKDGKIGGPYRLDGEHGIYVIKQER